jgi:lipoyl(octanoyl) transferase
MDCWRLILHGGHPAADNMAIDEAILTAYAEGKVPPTVRLYSWTGPAISLGYHQALERSRLDLDYCRDAGIELVRRSTGGRAVLHGHDLTFSVCVDDARIPAEYRGVTGSHVWLMRGIVAGFARLGIVAEIGPLNQSNTDSQSNTDCFAHVAECDVRTPDGAKVAGAAQVRRSGVFLEQGSIPHTIPSVDYGRIYGGIRVSQEYVLDAISRQTVDQAMIEGFAESLGIAFEIWDLTAYETDLYRELAKGKYASADWTYSKDCIDKSMLRCYTEPASSGGVSQNAQENPRR